MFQKLKSLPTSGGFFSVHYFHQFSAAWWNLVAFFQLFEEIAVRLLLFLHGADEHKIKDAEDDDERKQTDDWVRILVQNRIPSLGGLNGGGIFPDFA